MADTESPTAMQCAACYGTIDSRAKRCPHCAQSLVESDDSGMRVFAGIFGFLAVGFVGFGWYRFVMYDDLSDNLVGGDAYNYTILARCMALASSR